MGRESQGQLAALLHLVGAVLYPSPPWLWLHPRSLGLHDLSRGSPYSRPEALRGRKKGLKLQSDHLNLSPDATPMLLDLSEAGFASLIWSAGTVTRTPPPQALSSWP